MVDTFRFYDDGPTVDTTALLNTTIQNFQFCTTMNIFDEEIMYWIRLRSTTWFFRFLVDQYNNSRWLSMFKMTKGSVFCLAKIIKPHIEKKNTKFWLVVSILVRIAYTLFKLMHAKNYTICSEMFTIGWSIVSKILKEVVHAINNCFWHEISWPSIDKLQETQSKFQDLCSLPNVIGILDSAYFSISKPHVSLTNYFYFNTRG